MGEALKVQDLPVDCRLRIQSFLIGEPHYVKLNHSNKLKAIQNKYKIDYTEPRVWNNLYINQTQMSYEMRLKDIKPHMINTTRNVKRIVSFINNFQYGVREDDEDDETEEYNLDDDVYDEVDIDDDNPVKVVVELSLLSKDQMLYRGEIFNMNQHLTRKYTLEKPTKSLVSKALGMFVEECKRFKRKKERMVRRNELLQFNLTHFEVLVFLKRDDASDGEDTDRDNEDSD